MRLTAALTAFLFISLSASAATIKFVSGGGLSDGQMYVGPYIAEIDGVRSSVFCYDLAHTVGVQQEWQANLLSVQDLSAGYFSDRIGLRDNYYMVGWLFNELLKTSNSDSRIGIQHAAWLLFDPTAPPAGAAPWLTAANAARQLGYPSMDFSTLRFIESVPGFPRVQGLVVGGFPPSAAETPEVATGATALVGFGLMAICGRKRFVASRSRKMGTHDLSLASPQSLS